MGKKSYRFRWSSTEKIDIKSQIVSLFDVSAICLKVSKFQTQIFLFSFEQKSKRNFFLNALYYINYGVFNTMETLCIQISKNSLVRILIQMTRKFAFEINIPLLTNFFFVCLFCYYPKHI